jgi:TPR repeat protein
MVSSQANLLTPESLSILKFPAPLAALSNPFHAMNFRTLILLRGCLPLVIGLLLAGCGNSEFKALKAKAAKGDPQAQLDLAKAYMYGKGTQQDEAEARKWCEKAANQGLPAAQRIFGTMLRDAYGSPFRDLGKAREWLAKAVAQGDAEAKLELAATPEPPPTNSAR